MGQVKKVILYWLCERCGHEWPPKGEGEPKFCPKCKSPYWNTPRRSEKKADKAR